MRIREKSNKPSSCVKMSDAMNGDTPKTLTSSCKDSDPETSSDHGSSSEGIDINSLTHFPVNKGLKGRVRKPVESCESPGSPLSEDSPSSGGGRLKFFKDGKFILELSHRKEGEKTCWIPVKRKTYWPAVGLPPPGPNPPPSTRQSDTSTTYSVSDDSSSVQSSPWQRDHCWKQNHPKHNLNKDLQFFFYYGGYRPSSRQVKIKSRRPFDVSIPQVLIHCYMKSLKKRNRSQKNSSPRKDPANINLVIKFLWERALNPGRTDGIVSPRKRILREMEKVSLEEASKRQKAKTSLRSVGSHSISSILAKDNDFLRNSVLRNLLRSPSPPDAVQSGGRPAPAHQSSDGSVYHAWGGPPNYQPPQAFMQRFPFRLFDSNPANFDNTWHHIPIPTSGPQLDGLEAYLREQIHQMAQHAAPPTGSVVVPPTAPPPPISAPWRSTPSWHPTPTPPPRGVLSPRDSSDVPLNLSKNAPEC